MFGNGGDTPLSQFLNGTGSSAISSLGSYCNLCNTTYGACSNLALVNATNANATAALAPCGNNDSLSLAGAGGIGAGVTLAVVIALLGVAAFFGLVGFGGRRQRNGHDGSETGSVRPRTRRPRGLLTDVRPQDNGLMMKQAR